MVRLRQTGVKAVLMGCSEMLALGGAFVVEVEQAAFLQDGDDFIDQGVDFVVVAVDGEGESVGGASLEPVLHVVGHVGGGAGHDCVVVDDPVGDDVAQGPPLTGDFEGAGRWKLPAAPSQKKRCDQRSATEPGSTSHNASSDEERNHLLSQEP